MSRTNFDTVEIESWPEGTKKCWGCKELKALGAFHVMKQGLFGMNTYCKDCRRPKSQKQYQSLQFEKTMWQSAKGRAKRYGREFTITVEDIVIPERCPILDEPIVLIRHDWFAPSLDRMDSGGGYTPDNIMVMSKRANMLKNNITYDEVCRLSRFMAETQ